MVGDADDRPVVLDHHHRVPLVAQRLQDRDEAVGVAGMEADRRLVEDVQRTHQRGAQRGRQRDPLRLAPGQGGERPAQREVVEADVGEVTQPPLQLRDDARARAAVVRLQGGAGQELLRLPHRQRAHRVDVEPAHPHLQRLPAQPAAAAVGADLVPAITAQEHPHLDLVLPGLQPAEEADHALEFLVAFQHQAAMLFREVGPGHVQRNVMPAREALHLQDDGAVTRPVPGLDGAFRQRLRRVGDDELLFDLDEVAEPVAGRAGPERVVEGKEARLRLLE